MTTFAKPRSLTPRTGRPGADNGARLAGGAGIEIVPIVPFDEGLAAGRGSSREAIKRELRAMLADAHLRATLGSMGRRELEAYTASRLETPPDYTRYPELEDLYPERVEYLRGFAQGAGVSLLEAAVHSYVGWRLEIQRWWQGLQANPLPGAAIEVSHCSGVLMVGPDGVVGAHSAESGPPPRPRGWKPRPPRPYAGLTQVHEKPRTWVLRKPRTGYIEAWGVTNEKGVACCAGTSNSTFLDDPIEDTWPCQQVPLLRFARNVEHLEELNRRYTLHNWNRSSQVWADTSGEGVVVEKSFRRVGIRRLARDADGTGAIWCTEGYFHTPEMNEFQRTRRAEYVARSGKHPGCEDNQFFTDSAVRFTNLARLCHSDFGRAIGYRTLEHLRRVMCDHAPFPRAVCRHAGPDRAEYDQTVTMGSTITDVSGNRRLSRGWVPWKKYPCEVPERVERGPARP